MITNKYLSAVSIAVFTAIAAKPALAHSGHHGETGLMAALHHIGQSSFHIVMAGLSGGFALVLLWLVRQKLGKQLANEIKKAR